MTLAELMVVMVVVVDVAVCWLGNGGCCCWLSRMMKRWKIPPTVLKTL